MRFAVSITANNRPQYFRRVVESWWSTMGSMTMPFYVSLEPSENRDEMAELAKGLPNVTMIRNQDQYGALGNPYHAMERAFKGGADFVILGEDDSVVSPDVIHYFKHCAEEYKGDHVMAVCSFNQVAPSHDPAAVYKRPYFASVVWGTWSNRWEDLRVRWGFDYGRPWDRMMLEETVNFGPCVFPHVSRSQHIGKYGTHMQHELFESMQANTFFSEFRVYTFKEVAL